MNDVLRLDGVSKHFGERRVLESLNLHAERGEIISISAPSGTGKTTLLRLAAGLEFPTSGTIHHPDGATGYVFQEPRLLPWATASQNVAIVLQAKRIPASEAEKCARTLLGELELANAADLLPRQLSGGMAQRVSLARALIVEPSLLLLDEPFNGMDEDLRHRLVDYLRLYIGKNTPIVLWVTHHPDEIAAIATRKLELTIRK